MDVTIAAVAHADAGEFVEAVRASRSLHHPWIDPPDTAERFASSLEHADRDDQPTYLIRHVGCKGLVGYVSVSNIVRRAFQSASLGYAAFVGHAGRGGMTAGLQKVLRIAFGQLSLHRWRPTFSRPTLVHRSCATAGIREGGILAALLDGRRRLARPRALGTTGRAFHRLTVEAM